MISLNLSMPPLPTRDPVVDTQRLLTSAWESYGVALLSRVAGSALSIGSNSYATHAAAIGTTPIRGYEQAGGVYRIGYYASVVRAATTSSSLTGSYTWVDGGITRTRTFAAMAANTTAQEQGHVSMIRADRGTVVSFTTAYASVGGTPMAYHFEIRMELLP